ncbi:MAG: hypothetical protein K0R57_5974 [Paenibacillaceae bacterium]|nr:hypothetical protein [Paenibacillaceae bacterium]
MNVLRRRGLAPWLVCLILLLPLLWASPAAAESYRNVALGKTAAATSEHSASMVPGNAVDGSNSTIWVSNRNAQTDPGTIYWQVDLGEAYTVEEIRIRFRTNEYEQKNFEIRAAHSADFLAYTVLHVQGDTAAGVNFSAEVTDETPYRYIRYHRLPVPASGVLQNTAFAEFQVMAYAEDEPGEPEPPEGTAGSRLISDNDNLALLHPASGSTYFGNDEQHHYSAAVDGSSDTFWISWRSAGDNDAYWQVDLGAHYVLSRMELESRSDTDVASQRNNFEILASDRNDFSDYRVIGQASQPFPFNGVWVLDINDAESYRYLRYHKTAAAETGVLAEFRVSGEWDPSKIPNEVPVAGQAAISEPVYAGAVITGSYMYEDSDGDAEGGSLFRWLAGDDGGIFRPIAGQTTKQLELNHDAYAGMYIKFEVTPADDQGNVGAAVQSDAKLILPGPGQVLDSVNLSSPVTNMGIGDSVPLSLSGEYEHGGEARLALATVQYVSDNPSILHVSDGGLVTALGAGSAAVKAVVQLDNTVAESPSVLFHIIQKPTQAVYYVDGENGDDGQSGSFASPFKTIERAKAEARLINDSMTGDIIIYLRGGTYGLSNPLLFTPEDSGKNGYSIIYRAYGQEKPVVSGGQAVQNWSLHDEGKHIYKAAVDPGVVTRQLFVNGQRAVRARSQGGLPDAVQTDSGYTTSMTEMANWSNIRQVELVFVEEFTNPRNVIDSVYAAQGVATVRMREPGWTYNKDKGGTRPTLPVYIENAYELLDEPGEWYLDLSSHTLYYIPLPGEDVFSSSFELPVLEELVRLEGALGNPVSHIRFEGIAFTLATWLAPGTEQGHPDAQSNILRYGQTGAYRNEVFSGAAVNLRMAHSIVFERSEFARLGGAGINLFEGSQDNRITGGVFTDIAASGIQIGEPNRNNPYTMNPEDPRYLVKNNVVTNNYIAHIGQEYKSSVGIFAGYVQNLHAANNEIAYVPYSGITVGWGWSSDITAARGNAILHNYVHNVMEELHDGAGIYTLSAQPESVISGNYVDTGTNIGGIYLDQGTSYFEVTHNVVRNVTQWLKLTSSNNIHNVIQLNYTDKASFSDAGSNNLIGRNTLLVNPYFSQGALDIMEASGIESRYRTVIPSGE